MSDEKKKVEETKSQTPTEEKGKATVAKTEVETKQPKTDERKVESKLTTDKKPAESADKKDSDRKPFVKRTFSRDRDSSSRDHSRGGKTFGRDKKGGKDGKKRFNKRGRKDREESRYDNQVIKIRRVTKVTKGGKNMRFSALVVVGDRKGRVGYAIRKGTDFQNAVQKAQKIAERKMIKIRLTEDSSFPFESMTKYKAARVFLKPAKEGTGLIAGGYVRPVLELVGIKNAYSKIIGGTNKISGVQAMFKALEAYSLADSHNKKSKGSDDSSKNNKK